MGNRSTLAAPSTTRNPLLNPLVIAMIPRWSEAVPVVADLDVDHMVGLAENEEDANQFRQLWASRDDRPLLLLRCPSEGSLSLGVETVTEIASHHPNRPVGVLLADGPDASGFREERRQRWHRAFAKAVSDAILDVQICEYSGSWAISPPRLR